MGIQEVSKDSVLMIVLIKGSYHRYNFLNRLCHITPAFGIDSCVKIKKIIRTRRTYEKLPHAKGEYKKSPPWTDTYFYGCMALRECPTANLWLTGWRSFFDFDGKATCLF